METLIACLIGVILIVGLVALVIRIRATRRVTAGEVWHADRPPADVDADVTAALGRVKGARVQTVRTGQLRVVLRRSPVWTVLVAMLLFPVGLVALLYREDVPMDVFVHADGNGTQLRLDGRTEAHVLARVRAAVGSIPGVRPDQVVGV